MEVVAVPPGVMGEDMEIVAVNSLQCMDHIHRVVEVLGVATVAPLPADMELHLEEDMEAPLEEDMEAPRQEDMVVLLLEDMVDPPQGDMGVLQEDMGVLQEDMGDLQEDMGAPLLAEGMVQEEVNYPQEVEVMFRVNLKL